jgi:hypothetical protein
MDLFESLLKNHPHNRTVSLPRGGGIHLQVYGEKQAMPLPPPPHVPYLMPLETQYHLPFSFEQEATAAPNPKTKDDNEALTSTLTTTPTPIVLSFVLDRVHHRLRRKQRRRAQLAGPFFPSITDYSLQLVAETRSSSVPAPKCPSLTARRVLAVTGVAQRYAESTTGQGLSMEVLNRLADSVLQRPVTKFVRVPVPVRIHVPVPVPVEVPMRPLWDDHGNVDDDTADGNNHNTTLLDLNP